ncbi:type II secretion system protein [Clostridium ihumii]|uniref:type II secretion system protein n=1 Tax=Clostridium ihumii TaxID=1470356 RepID=UPI00054F2D92|nr:type II secretion system protein [Clostridium ihumii]
MKTTNKKIKNSIRTKEKTFDKKKKGFTLIELVVVVSIMAILLIIALPKFASIQENAKKKADVATAKNIAMALNAEMSCGSDIEKIDKNKDIINKYFDGDIKQQAKVTKDEKPGFVVYIKDEDIKIFTGKRQVYPELKENQAKPTDCKSIEILEDRNSSKIDDGN